MSGAQPASNHSLVPRYDLVGFPGGGGGGGGFGGGDYPGSSIERELYQMERSMSAPVNYMDNSSRYANSHNTNTVNHYNYYAQPPLETLYEDDYAPGYDPQKFNATRRLDGRPAAYHRNLGYRF